MSQKMRPVAIMVLDAEYQEPFLIDDPRLQQVRAEHPNAVFESLVYEQAADELLVAVVHTALGIPMRRP